LAEALKRGDLYFVKPPGFVGKVRPAVIVQADKYNSDPPSVTVCLLTSHLVDSRLRVRIDPAPENGLTKSSHVMIDKAMSLPLDRLDNRIGAVSAAQLEAISASLRDWLDL
jgi:mRNA interferase MazF